MLREKIVAQSACRMIAICDSTKAVERLPLGPLPVEVLPFARTFVAHGIEVLGAQAILRAMPDGSIYRTDQGNCVFDCHGPADLPIEAFAAKLQSIPGVLSHGLFLDEIDALYIARNNRVECVER